MPITEIVLFKVSLTPMERHEFVEQVDVILKATDRNDAWAKATDILGKYADQNLNVSVKQLLVGYRND